MRHTIETRGEVIAVDEFDAIYRDAVPPGQKSTATTPAPAPTDHDWAETMQMTNALVFRYSAVTWNAHRIHYDRPYATREEGYPGLVVHGPLTAVMLMELVRAHAGRPAASFEFRGRVPLFDLAPFRLTAVPEDGRVALEARGPDGTVAMTASAELG